MRLRLHLLRLWPHGLSVVTELGRLANQYDVVVSQNYTPLRTRAVRAVFIHDLMFEEHPEFFSIKERMYFSGMAPSARYADVVFSSTATEAARIARMRPELSERIRSVGLSLPTAFVSQKATDPGIGVKPMSFILCVGRLNVRKNVDRLIDALLSADLISPEFPLLIVGQPDGLSIRGTDATDGRVRFLGRVDDGELKWLYEQCRLFVFPSLDEGFGLPVVEAAVSGAPMVLSDIPAFRELAPSAKFFDPTDEGAIVAAVAAEIALGAPSQSPVIRIPTWSEVVRRIRSELQRELASRV
jgi:glycosyltransferase involved in cell wall biosynthesis